MPVSSIIGDSLTVRTSKIAVNNGSGSFGTVRDLYGTVTITAEARIISAIREGNGKELAAFAKISGLNLTLEFAANNLQILADLLGLTYSTTGSTPNQVGTLKILDLALPYFAFIGGLDDDAGLENAFHFWVPRVKINSDTVQILNASGNLQPEFGNVQIQCRVFPDVYYLEGAASEVQSVDITGSPTGGTFTLSFGSETTSALAYDADAATVQAALEALNNIGSGNVTVTGTNPAFTMTFGGDLANVKLPLLTGDESSLTGGTPGFTIARDTTGSPGNDLIATLYEDEQGTTPLIPPAL